MPVGPKEIMCGLSGVTLTRWFRVRPAGRSRLQAAGVGVGPDARREPARAGPHPMFRRLSAVLTMQDALLALTRYWTERGCVMVPPVNTDVAAVSLDPATVLPVLAT